MRGVSQLLKWLREAPSSEGFSFNPLTSHSHPVGRPRDSGSQVCGGSATVATRCAVICRLSSGPASIADGSIGRLGRSPDVGAVLLRRHRTMPRSQFWKNSAMVGGPVFAAWTGLAELTACAVLVPQANEETTPDAGRRWKGVFAGQGPFSASWPVGVTHA